MRTHEEIYGTRKIMDYSKSLVYKHEENDTKMLYEFLATDYDISSLAEKIYAMKNAKINLMNLKKISCSRS